MAAQVSPPTLDRERLDLDRQRLELDYRKQALDESLPRKWGPVLFGAMASVTAALISGGFAWMQADAASKQQKAEATRAAVTASAQRQTENARLALDMYFKYIAAAPLTESRTRDHIKLIANIADQPKIQEILEHLTLQTLADRPAATPPSEVAATLPDVIAPKAAYVPGDFVGYIQYFGPRAGDADKADQALRTLGLRVPGHQEMPQSKSPDGDQVRFYKPRQLAAATQIAAALGKATGTQFRAVRVPNGDDLPNGVLEIWLGKSPAPQPPPPAPAPSR